MTVEQLIEELEKYNPEMQVNLTCDGENYAIYDLLDDTDVLLIQAEN
jgi:hypothetical protein